jgi:hypothetical protein
LCSSETYLKPNVAATLGSKDITIKRHLLFFNLLFTKMVKSTTKLMKAPYGTCRRVVTSVEYPKPLMMIVPKFEIPPVGVEDTNAMKNNK